MNSPTESGSRTGSVTTDKTAPLTAATHQQTAVNEITRLHNEIIDSARTTLDKAIRIGELLAGVRSELNHGEWMPWLKLNLPFSDRTARNYVRCFEERDRLKLETISNLTDAYRLLEEPENVLSPAEQLQLERLEANMEKNIESIDKSLSELYNSGSPDAWLDEPLDEQAVLALPAGTSEKAPNDDDLIYDTVVSAVISRRFRSGGLITRREILYLLRLRDAARQEASARKGKLAV